VRAVTRWSASFRALEARNGRIKYGPPGATLESPPQSPFHTCPSSPWADTPFVFSNADLFSTRPSAPGVTVPSESGYAMECELQSSRSEEWAHQIPSSQLSPSPPGATLESPPQSPFHTCPSSPWADTRRARPSAPGVTVPSESGYAMECELQSSRSEEWAHQVLSLAHVARRGTDRVGPSRTSRGRRESTVKVASSQQGHARSNGAE
jgi:hypothetical protein